MKRRHITGIAASLLAGAVAVPAYAAPAQRVQVIQRGDFVLIGNTLAQDCGPGVVPPIVGTVGACGTNTNDSAPDLFWRADAPAAGQASANNTIDFGQARSSANLVLPAGVAVTNVYLYWAGRVAAGGMADTSVTLEGPGGASQNITAIGSSTAVLIGTAYQSVADVTSLVQQAGAGVYRVGGVDNLALLDVNDNTFATGWWMVVIYTDPAQPARQISVFDGLDILLDGNSELVTLSGFTVPMSNFDAKLGVIAYDGDDQTFGDGLRLNNVDLSDALNPAMNFFNSTRSRLGLPDKHAGDLPELAGTARSMSGLDLDIIDIAGQIMGGATSADIEAFSSGDTYFLGGFITSISTLTPEFSTSSKTVVDLDGGFLEPGDELEYTITVTNTGADASANTVVTDVLPPQVDYVPGSIQVSMTAKTDAASDDEAEFVAGTITARVGTGANATQGGTLAIGETTTVKFRVTVHPTAGGTIENQASISAGGQAGTGVETYPTDGNGGDPGAPPTTVIVDSDGDGLSNDQENAAGTNPNDADSDDDGALDGDEPSWDQDSDGDGLINALDPDSDNDGLFDGTELGLACGPATDPAAGACIPDADMGATTTDPLKADTDSGGVRDGSEDTNLNGQVDPNELDPNVGADDTTSMDADNDGLSDGLETTIGTDPNDADSDDDGVVDGDEPNPTVDTDGDGLINALDLDSDDDGLFDGTELGLACGNPATDPAANACIADADSGATTTLPLDPDTDGGGVRDGSEDINGNGQVDLGEIDPNFTPDDGTKVDSDNDGLTDDFETELGTDPNDADSDDDGVTDGAEPNPTHDTDGDGLKNGVDPDSDNDGLFDGTELGLGCSNPATNPKADACRPDADMGATKTSPIDGDTDNGGVIDGSEDTNLNGQVDPGELDPNNGPDDGTVTDADNDGLADDLETTLGTDPNDADSDDDGVLDGNELNPSHDTDGDGVVNAADPDSDNDGLFDGTELGLDCGNAATDPAADNCIPDGDMGATKTSPLDRDTDNGGASDGSEDPNLNGVVDPTEQNPVDNPNDDSAVGDADSDGLGDALEGFLGTDPNDADSDDDGVIDGEEPNPGADTDGDGIKNALDPDSDDDGLFDGTELGKNCTGPGTDVGAGTCKLDGDFGSTTTSPVNADTDYGGVSDGDEDTNKDGVVDPGEKNPNNRVDDAVECVTDAECGGVMSGMVCDATSTCINGCRGTGNGCPTGQTCSSTDDTIGICTPDGSGGAGGMGGGAGGGGPGGAGGVGGAGGAGGAGGTGGASDDIRIAGSGCFCNLPRGSGNDDSAFLALLVGAGVVITRRRRRKA